MIKSFLTSGEVIKGEPALDDYLRANQTDFDDIMDEAFDELSSDLIDQNLEVMKICTPLSLLTSATQIIATNNAISNEDFAQRQRLVIDVTAITGNAVFTLQGTNDSGTTYTAIKLRDGDGSKSTSMTISATGEYSYFITHLYKKYRLQLISIGTTITYSSYAIEDKISRLHRELTRKKVYGSLTANQGDVWEGKYKYYEQSYLGLLASTKFAYDADDSGDISEDEGETNLNQTVDFVV